jgi:23S rRNA pseudouridine2605 synthase
LSSNPVIPSADQLAAARSNRWHQTGEALLTFENVRSWLNAAGFVLFTPRAAQLPSPAPSMVEAVLGAANATPTLTDTDQARSLLARLIAEGAAVPLNLLGSAAAAGDTPDFVVASAMFPYIFTLRGDKAWKLPPSTSGASKVSPLALAAYTQLADRNLSAYDLATQLGKEVTESAVLRALNELWSHLRVLPIPQADGAATVWELTATRFTKQLKAGSNAGLPTALSALITLYLGQSIVASEEEIETFLSPLTARSRIRDVVHALMAARQLETVAVDGKTVLHVTGDLPVFLAPTPMVDPELGAAIVIESGSEPFLSTDADAPRIKKFIAKPRKIGTGYVTKPGQTSGGSGYAKVDGVRERRPFTRESNRPDRPSFTKPWAEEKADRLAAEQASANTGDEGSSPSERPQEAPRTYDRKPSFDRGGSRPSYGSKPAFGSRPSFGNKPSFGSKPAFNRDRGGFAGKPSFSRDGDSRPPRRDFAPRPSGEGSGSTGDFAPRKTFSKPGTFGRKREGGFTGKPSFGRDSQGGDSRPPRRDFGSRPTFDGPRKPFVPREGGSSSSSYGARPSFSRDRDGGSGSSSRGERPAGPMYRKFDAPRTPRPYSSDSPRPARSEGSGYAGKPSGGYAGKSSGGYAGKSSGGYAGKSSGGYAGKSSGGYAGKPSGDYSPRPSSRPSGGSDSFSDRKPYSKPSGGGFAGKKPFERASYSGKPSGGYAGKSGGGYASKSGGGGYAGAGRPATTFDKFKDNKKPFGKRAPTRKYKPQEGE